MKCFAVLLLLSVVGCGSFTRTVYVKPGQAVRLRETIKDAKVWVRDAQGTVLPANVDLPEGGYYLADPGVASGF